MTPTPDKNVLGLSAPTPGTPVPEAKVRRSSVGIQIKCDARSLKIKTAVPSVGAGTCGREHFWSGKYRKYAQVGPQALNYWLPMMHTYRDAERTEILTRVSLSVI